MRGNLEKANDLTERGGDHEFSYTSTEEGARTVTDLVCGDGRLRHGGTVRHGAGSHAEAPHISAAGVQSGEDLSDPLVQKGRRGIQGSYQGTGLLGAATRR